MRYRIPFYILTCFLCTALACPAFAQTLGQGEPYPVPYFRLIFGLLISCILAFLVVFALKKYRDKAGTNNFPKLFSNLKADDASELKIIETRRLSQYADISLVEYKGERFLLAIGPNSIKVLNGDPSQFPAKD